MENLIFVTSIILIIVGIIGSILPVLPGVPLAWVGFVIVYSAPSVSVNWNFILISLTATIVVSIADYLLPIAAIKKYGGSSCGIKGATFGMIAGFLLGPLGIILGPFIGAFLGELYWNQSSFKIAYKAAFGSMMGFLLASGLKILVGMWFLVKVMLLWIKYLEIF